MGISPKEYMKITTKDWIRISSIIRELTNKEDITYENKENIKKLRERFTFIR